MRVVSFYIAYLILLMITIAISAQIGSFESSFSDLINAVFNFDATNSTHIAIIKLRLPRILMGFCVGGMLALAGYLMQVMVNNPLADPFILGTSSAAAVGANLSLLGFLSLFGVYSSVFMAFAMALGVTFVVIIIAQNKGVIQPSKMLLGGIAISSLMTTIISLMSYITDSPNKLKTIVFWVMGSLESSNWVMVKISLVTLLVCTIYFVLKTNHLNILLLGFNKAKTLGLNERKLRWEVLVGASLLSAVGVAFTGPIGFVGLMVPHFVRALFGLTHRLNLLNTVLIGGLFVVIADLMSKIIYPPMGLPIGLITSLFGVPFFVYLLSKKGYTFK